MLLGLIVFAMGVVRNFFSPENTRALLAGRREGGVNVLAAGLGVLTPLPFLLGGAPFYRRRLGRSSAWG